MAHDYLKRPIVDEQETIIFAFMYALYANEIPPPITVANTIVLEDILERQNCFGDENLITTEDNPFWINGSFKPEYDKWLSNLEGDLIQRYGNINGQERFFSIQSCLRDWFNINWTAERVMAGKSIDTTQITQIEAEIVTKLDGAHDNPEIYRRTVDESWLKTLILTICDGDKRMLGKVMEPLLAATLLLQISEDVANRRRDSRIGKHTYVVKQGNDSFDGLSHINRLQVLLEMGRPYLNEITANQFLLQIIKLGWIARTVAVSAIASLHGDQWRNQKLFDEIDHKSKLFSSL